MAKKRDTWAEKKRRESDFYEAVSNLSKPRTSPEFIRATEYFRRKARNPGIRKSFMNYANGLIRPEDWIENCTIEHGSLEDIRTAALIRDILKDKKGAASAYMTAGKVWEDIESLRIAEEMYSQLRDKGKAREASAKREEIEKRSPTKRSYRDTRLDYDPGDIANSFRPEGALFFISILSLIIGIFLLSPVITGNTIGNLTMNASSTTGLVLLFTGLIELFFFSKLNRKN